MKLSIALAEIAAFGLVGAILGQYGITVIKWEYWAMIALLWVVHACAGMSTRKRMEEGYADIFQGYQSVIWDLKAQLEEAKKHDQV
jgi:hypothetical protein